MEYRTVQRLMGEYYIYNNPDTSALQFKQACLN
jgi:hypothetical protein